MMPLNNGLHALAETLLGAASRLDPRLRGQTVIEVAREGSSWIIRFQYRLALQTGLEGLTPAQQFARILWISNSLVAFIFGVLVAIIEMIL